MKLGEMMESHIKLYIFCILTLTTIEGDKKTATSTETVAAQQQK